MENHKNSILIVDDNKDNIKVLGLALKERGFDLTIAFSGPDALKALETSLYDLILLDIMMPGMDGFEVCTIIKSDKRTRDIPVIFITALTETDNIVKGFELGGVDYLTKPIRKRELFARVETQLELRRQRQQLEKQTIELKETIASRDKLYSIIAHDLRTPLANIKSVLAALSGDLIDKASFSKLVDMLLTTTNETYDLLENLLLWSKNKLSMIKPEKTDFVLDEILFEATDLLKPAAAKKNIGLSCNASSSLMIHADRNMVSTIIRNLVSNAVKFTQKGGRVTISATKQNGSVELQVEDNGVGISEKNREKLFSNNGQFTTFGTDKEKGSGLGFRLIMDFVKYNNGTIHLKSEEGKGSCFRIIFPAYQNGRS